MGFHKYFFIGIVLFCSTLYSQSAIKLSAIVADRITRQPIVYANVGFINRGVGTVTDTEGYFELSFLENRIMPVDTLQLTMQGYYPLRIASTKLQTIMKNTQILFLSPMPNDKKARKTIDRNNLEPGKIGSLKVSSIKSGWWQGAMQGAELASLVPVSSSQTYLERLQFTVMEQKADSTKVRINIYDVSAKNTPGKKITSSIYHTIIKKQGEVSIDLTTKDIFLDRDVIIGIELLESYGENARHMQFAISDKIGTSFFKTASQDNWQELPYNTIGFLITVLQSPEKGTSQKTGVASDHVSGIVTASEKPVQGCEVSVKGTLKTTYTAADGSFHIEADYEDVLTFRSLINESKEVLIKDATNINVVLTPKYDELDEVVIQAEKQNEQEEKVNTAFGEIKKEKLGYAVYSKSKEELGKSATTLAELMKGRFPGLIVYGPSGQERYKIRGNSTFVGSGTPLFVVDGMALTTIPKNLDVNIVTDITVIPGLAGSTRYGSLGRNGVILIKTTNIQNKSGDQNTPKNNLLVKGNDYDNSAVDHSDTKTFKNTVFNASGSFPLSEIKERYLSYQKDNPNDIGSYIEGFHYFVDKDAAFAFDILASATAIADNNPKILRGLAFIYRKHDRFEKAHTVYQRIGALEPRRAQTYIDLAQSYVANKKYTKAFSLYTLMLDNKIPGVVFTNEVLEDIIIQLKHLITNHKNLVDYLDVHPSFYNKALGLDARIVFEWNDPQSEFELQFVDPDNKYFVWSHTVAAQSDILEKEKSSGYNYKHFVLDGAKKGRWLFNIKGYSSTAKNDNIPQFATCIIYKNYGMPNEEKWSRIIDLDEIVDKNTSIGQIILE